MNFVQTKKSDLQSDRPDETGSPFPLGSTHYPTGVNFSIFCRSGESVDLLFFDHEDDLNHSREFLLDTNLNKTYHYWHIFVPGVKAGQLYGYRIHGPYEPSNGQWYDPDKILLDPYAKAVVVPETYSHVALTTRGKPECPSMKSVVTDYSTYDWDGDKHIRRPFSQTIIYELHVRGFTKH